LRRPRSLLLHFRPLPLAFLFVCNAARHLLFGTCRPPSTVALFLITPRPRPLLSSKSVALFSGNSQLSASVAFSSRAPSQSRSSVLPLRLLRAGYLPIASCLSFPLCITPPALQGGFVRVLDGPVSSLNWIVNVILPLYASLQLAAKALDPTRRLLSLLELLDAAATRGAEFVIVRHLPSIQVSGKLGLKSP
jgi:hypothetical protein